MSDVGEDWYLYVHKLHGGIVVLGVLKEEAPEGTNERFATNAARFGASVEGAMGTPERTIELPFEHVIIDNNGILLWTTGGIPLKASSPAIPASSTFAPTRQINGKIHAVFLNPVVSKSGSEVGQDQFCALLGKELCAVIVAPSSEPVFLEGEVGGQLFVRVGNSTRPFDAKEAFAYARDRWGGLALPRWHPHRPIPHPAG